MKSIAFIDCFMQTPVNNCVNTFIERTGLPCTYHMPSQYGFDTLKNLKKADAFVILGSASNVTEPLDWHKELIDFIVPRIENFIPTFGICFGHQLIAHAYGCKVDYLYPDHFKHTEIRPIEFTSDALGFHKGETLNLGFAHRQAVLSMTDDFECFAKSKICEIEGLKLKKYPYWSLQAHPESSARFLREDAKAATDSLLQETIQNGAKILDGFIEAIKAN